MLTVNNLSLQVKIGGQAAWGSPVGLCARLLADVIRRSETRARRHLRKTVSAPTRLRAGHGFEGTGMIARDRPNMMTLLVCAPSRSKP